MCQFLYANIIFQYDAQHCYIAKTLNSIGFLIYCPINSLRATNDRSVK